MTSIEKRFDRFVKLGLLSVALGLATIFTVLAAKQIKDDRTPVEKHDIGLVQDTVSFSP